MIYSVYADPSDGFSNHWSNAPKEEKVTLCPQGCDPKHLVEDTPDGMKGKKLYICKHCGDCFEIEN